ncbi:hypothetical protein [Gordonia sp. YC-JH1]|uniref:hypothetical protein n=1 Tax=Gordonia sp. YC-JH1 TaxID=2059875 RepID=UPI001F1F7B55|nr:hypothetical protein [Gordonia sp. YC-JH1]
MKRTLATSTAICGICLGLAAPAAVAATPTPVFLPSVATAGPAVTEYTDVLGDWVQGADDDAHVVVVPGRMTSAIRGSTESSGAVSRRS